MKTASLHAMFPQKVRQGLELDSKDLKMNILQ